MDINKLRQLAGLEPLVESNGALGVPEQPNLKALSQGKDPMTHMKPQSPAAKPEVADLKPVGTGKAAKDPMSSTPQSPAAKPEVANLKPVGTGKAAKNPLREEADALIADIVKGVNALADGLTEGHDNLTFYRHDALKRIHAVVRRYVD